MSFLAAGARRSSTSCRAALSPDTTETLFLVAFAFGKSIREPDERSGGSCNNAYKIDMELYFLRHGEADWPDWKKSDDERPLTDFGKKEVRDVAKFLARLKVRPDLIVTSPLPRAAQTAEIAADYLKPKLRKDELLAPGFGMSELGTILKRHRSKALMLVGHEPDFTNVISGLTGASLKLSKAGVALVDVDPESQEGRVLWLFPPKFARKSK